MIGVVISLTLGLAYAETNMAIVPADKMMILCKADPKNQHEKKLSMWLIDNRTSYTMATDDTFPDVANFDFAGFCAEYWKIVKTAKEHHYDVTFPKSGPLLTDSMKIKASPYQILQDSASSDDDHCHFGNTEFGHKTIALAGCTQPLHVSSVICEDGPTGSIVSTGVICSDTYRSNPRECLRESLSVIEGIPRHFTPDTAQ